MADTSKPVCCACCDELTDPPSGSCTVCMVGSIEGCTDPSLCARCVQNHARMRRYDGHFVLLPGATDPAVDALAPFGGRPRGPFCSTHRDRKLTMICGSCAGALLCDLCLPSHVGHVESSVRSLTEAAASARYSIGCELILPGSDTQQTLLCRARAAAQLVSAERDAVARTVECASTAIDSVEDAMVAAVHARCKQLRADITAHASITHASLQDELTSADAALAAVEASSLNTERALTALCDADIVSFAASIEAQVRSARDSVTKLRQAARAPTLKVEANADLSRLNEALIAIHRVAPVRIHTTDIGTGSSDSSEATSSKVASALRDVGSAPWRSSGIATAASADLSAKKMRVLKLNPFAAEFGSER
jgi:hypothetical protein